MAVENKKENAAGLEMCMKCKGDNSHENEKVYRITYSSRYDSHNGSWMWKFIKRNIS